ncbi:MAG: iron ABC transporter permease [Pseudomonadota bacterium]
MLRRLLWPGLLLALIGISIIVSTAFGVVSIPLADVVTIFLTHLVPNADTSGLDLMGQGKVRVVWELRWPRALLACAVGGGLACVGAVLQGATRNPLADPYLFGVSSGGVLGAVAHIVFIGERGLMTIPLAAFAGACLSLLMVTTLVQQKNTHVPAGRLILAGVAVSFALTAIANFILFLGDHRAINAIIFWLLGGLGRARWETVWFPIAAVICGVIVFSAFARQLNALAMGDESAMTLGIDVRRLRLVILVVCALVTGVLVSLSGAIAFVGLMIPHVVRAMIGADYRWVIPISAGVGAVFLIWIDVIARLVFAPQELPIGIITSGIGGIFFLFFIRRLR